MAAQLGSGRVLVLALAAGVLVGVRLQPRLVHAVEQVTQTAEAATSALQGAEVL